MTLKCPKCGEECKPEYRSLTDKLVFTCRCGYMWSRNPLDKTNLMQYTGLKDKKCMSKHLVKTTHNN